VKAGTLTVGTDHTVADEAYDAIRSAVIRLIRAREVRFDSAGPVYWVLSDVETEGRARELAAALHAALYGDLASLARAAPETSQPGPGHNNWANRLRALRDRP
jgi:hypothetical protein